MAREEGERAKRRINLSVVGMSGIIEMAGNILADYMAFDPEVEFEINEFTNIKDITNGNPDLMMTVSFTPSYEQLKREVRPDGYKKTALILCHVQEKSPGTEGRCGHGGF